MQHRVSYRPAMIKQHSETWHPAYVSGKVFCDAHTTKPVSKTIAPQPTSHPVLVCKQTCPSRSVSAHLRAYIPFQQPDLTCLGGLCSLAPI